VSRAQVRRRRLLALAAVAGVVVLVWVGAGAVLGHGDDGPARQVAADRARATPAPTATGWPTARPSPKPSGSTRAATRAAGTSRGTGRLVAVPGRAAAPGRGPVTTVRVEVEQGVEVDPAQFADAVLATLNDDRSWGHGGARTFARTSGSADVVVVLASPQTSARMCLPLRTFGKLSCRSGNRAVLTSYRWMRGTEEFPDLGVYRQYVVNHEVGHVLGHGHEQCGGAGRLAPVMQQQTKQVAPCRPNAWPFP
jgi:hypothetical protein